MQEVAVGNSWGLQLPEDPRSCPSKLNGTCHQELGKLLECSLSAPCKAEKVASTYTENRGATITS